MRIAVVGGDCFAVVDGSAVAGLDFEPGAELGSGSGAEFGSEPDGSDYSGTDSDFAVVVGGIDFVVVGPATGDEVEAVLGSNWEQAVGQVLLLG